MDDAGLRADMVTVVREHFSPEFVNRLGAWATKLRTPYLAD